MLNTAVLTGQLRDLAAAATKLAKAADQNGELQPLPLAEAVVGVEKLRLQLDKLSRKLGAPPKARGEQAALFDDENDDAGAARV